jgi:hypothetical protein
MSALQSSSNSRYLRVGVLQQLLHWEPASTVTCQNKGLCLRGVRAQVASSGVRLAGIDNPYCACKCLQCSTWSLCLMLTLLLLLLLLLLPCAVTPHGAHPSGELLN